MTHEQVKQAIAKAIYQEKQQTASAIENFSCSQRPRWECI
jgi:hypothetical protein